MKAVFLIGVDHLAGLLVAVAGSSDRNMEGFRVRVWFEKLTDLLSLAVADGLLQVAIADLVRELGFDTYAYLNVQPGRTYAVSNYAPAWQERYFELDYARIDPVVSTGRAKMEPFAWSAADPRQTIPKSVRRFYAEAGDFGIRSGISIPVRTAFGHMSMLTLASRKEALSLELDIDQIAAVTAATLLHARLQRHEIEPTAQANVELTAKQALCLAWSAEGKTMRDIATIENMSYATVNFHLNNARRTLDAGSLAQATAIATKLRLI